MVPIQSTIRLILSEHRSKRGSSLIFQIFPLRVYIDVCGWGRDRTNMERRIRHG